ncbi:hypothetical protein QTP88_002780 [Uroleucon formosanum]
MENELKWSGKHGFRMGIWNIRSLYKPGALKAISDAIKKYKNVSITSLQEIRWPGEKSVKTKEMTLCYSGDKSGRYINAMDFLVNEHLLPHVKHFEPVNDRICYMHIANKYGDFNAKVGNEAMCKPTVADESDHDMSNGNGIRLIEYVIAKDLIITSTFFPESQYIFWFNQKCEDIIKKRNQPRLKMLQFPTQANFEVYELKKKEAAKIIRQQKRTAEKNKIEEMQKYGYSPKEFFRRCKSLKNGYKPAISSLTNEKGDLIMNSKDMAEEFKNYFNKLLNNNKTEIIQEDRWDYKLILLIWQKEQFPKEWETAIICPIFKKNDQKQVINYREISLLDVGYKVVSSLLLGRLQKYAEEIIGSYQCGLRKGKSTTNHNFAIRQTLKKHHEYNKDIHLLFVDFKEAATEGDYNKLLVFERKMLRKMFRPTSNVIEQKWLTRSNEELKNLYSKENVVQFVRTLRLAWAGHAWRADGSLIKMVMVNQIDQKRPKGCPKQRWLDVVRKDIEELKLDWNGNLDLVYAREVWGKLVLEAKSLNGS